MSEHEDESTNETTMSCTWNKQTSDSVSYNTKYLFELNMSNVLGIHEQYYTFNLTSIVQLDAPPKLDFNAELNKLSWGYPNLIDEDRNLFPLLTFKVLVTHICEHFEACLDIEPKIYILNNTMKHLELDLKPYSLYNFSIACKVDDPFNKYWSSFSHLDHVRTKGAGTFSFWLITRCFHS